MEIIKLRIGTENAASAQKLIFTNLRAKQAGDIIKQALSLPHGKSANYRNILKPLNINESPDCKKIYTKFEKLQPDLNLLSEKSTVRTGGVTEEYLDVLFPNYFRRIY